LLIPFVVLFILIQTTGVWDVPYASCYNELLRFLIHTGWENGLTLEEELPDELMPRKYIELSKEWRNV